MNPLFTALTLLAEEGPRNTGPDFGKASPFGLLVVVLLLIGVIFLVWSMNRHLKKLPQSFDETDQQTPDSDAADSQPDRETGASDGDNRESREQPPG